EAAAEAGLAEAGTNDAGQRTWTLHYTVAEDTSDLPLGMSATTGSVSLTVVVADEGDGTLDAHAETADGAWVGVATNPVSFTNTFDNAQVSVNVRGTKVLDAAGTDTTLADIAGKFTFTLSGSDGAPMPEGGVTSATNAADGSVDFGSITFHRSDLGGEASRTFTYTVAESGSAAGVTNDAAIERTFTVTVVDNGDAGLSVALAPAAPLALFSFANSYDVVPTSVKLGAVKTVNGGLPGAQVAPQSFAFTLTALDGAPLPWGVAGSSMTVYSDAETGAVDFAPISYDRPGTYRYTLAERAGSAGGYGYTDKIVDVVVTVTDNHDGTLSAAVSYDGVASTLDQPSLPAFDNTYTTTPTEVEFGGTKAIDNGDHGTTLSPVTGAFSFELAALSGTLVDGAELAPADVPMPAGSSAGEDGTPAKVVANSGATFSFGAIAYGTPGTYRYQVTEQIPASGADETITYSALVYEVTVVVTDNGDGTLSASAFYGVADGEGGDLAPVAGISFTNGYAPKAVEAQLGAHKALEGRDLAEGEFAFDLYEGTLSADQIASGEVMPLASASNAADGTVVFSALSFDTVGTYDYTIAERPGDLGGVSYDGSVHHATVTVSENDAHELVASVSYDGAGDVPPTFANAYDASGSLVLEGSKAIEGQGWADGSTYEFVITNDADPTGTPVSTGAVTPSTQAGGNPAGFAFTPIEYTLDGLEAAAEAGLAEAGTNDAGQRTWTLH
ncbi:MAG: hypothetical protein KHY83_11355, partial [Coriobacteriia bacterium]|nr:hypothetical protein [Coriobacteriia bacterium]MBS5479246.1 hypothetical protein [Coriobacteriia bacterium]